MPPQAMTPVPDPTKLTTDAVDKAKVELKELFDTKLGGFRELVESQFQATKDLAKQQNDSNTLAISKTELSTTKQIEAQAARIDDLKESVSKLEGRNWSTVGAYIVGAVGIAALVAAAVLVKQ